MARSIIAAVILLILQGLAIAGEDQGKDTLLYTKPDALHPDRTIVYDRNHGIKGYTRPDALNRNRTIIKSVDGSTKGYVKPDALNPKRNIIYWRTTDK